MGRLWRTIVVDLNDRNGGKAVVRLSVGRMVTIGQPRGPQRFAAAAISARRSGVILCRTRDRRRVS